MLFSSFVANSTASVKEVVRLGAENEMNFVHSIYISFLRNIASYVHSITFFVTVNGFRLHFFC